MLEYLTLGVMEQWWWKLMNEVKQVGNIVDTGNWDNPQRGRIYSVDGCCPSLNTVGGGGLEPKILEEPKLLGGLGEMKSNNGTQYFQQDRVYSSDGIAMCHPANIPGGSYKYCMEEIKVLGNYHNSNHDASRVVDTNGLAPTVKENQGIVTGIAEIVKIKQATKQGYIECEVGGVFDGSYPDSETRRGRVQENGNISPTLTADGSENLYRVEKDIDNPLKGKTDYGWHFEQNVYSENSNCSRSIKAAEGSGNIPKLIQRYRIRKLTPRECGRLMGVSDEDITKMLEVNSNSQCYKQFGNSIVVSVMEAMFRNLNIKGVSNE